ncbi:MAG: hypothetical protein IJ638_00060 [Alphaproteobacteria bacterium]|nr:hypothetical protein [Alphaproteobacteria bacterium]
MDTSKNITDFKDVLKDSYNNPDVHVSREQRFNLAAVLLRFNRAISDDILTIASMLNRNPEDSFYITYAILMQFNDSNMLDFDNKKNETLTFDKKADALEESREIISKNINNREFIDQLYKDIRLGLNIAKIYYPKQLKNDLSQIKDFTEMLNILKTSERF